MLPLLVATDGAIAALGAGSRRLRPSVILGGVEGLAERAWEGKHLRAGNVVIYMEDLRQRCVMTTCDPDTLEQDMGVLRRIVRELDGTIEIGQTVDVFEQ